MKEKILPGIFISVGVLFALTGPLAADKPQPTIITFDAPGAGTGPAQGTVALQCPVARLFRSHS
jgi:hypothetical protein